jgi:hypothetical protein
MFLFYFIQWHFVNYKFLHLAGRNNSNYKRYWKQLVCRGMEMKPPEWVFNTQLRHWVSEANLWHITCVCLVWSGRNMNNVKIKCAEPANFFPLKYVTTFPRLIHRSVRWEKYFVAARADGLKIEANSAKSVSVSNKECTLQVRATFKTLQEKVHKVWKSYTDKTWPTAS